ncbi:MAG: cytochrome b/b6 domain-containing protein, partial [Asticcacaulis sp.]
AGACIAGLLVFRLWWGFFGGQAARFSDFVRGPKAIWAYLFPGKTKNVFSPGHNPLGALSVIALLLATIVTVTTGLFTEDTDDLYSGPFAGMLDYDQGRLAAAIHGYAFEAVEILVVLHLLAIAWYTFVRRKALVAAMIHGKKMIEDATTPLKKARWWSLLTGLALGGTTTACLIYLSARA